MNRDDSGAETTPHRGTTDRNGLATDLRALAGVRSRATARTKPFPHLFTLLPTERRTDVEARYAAVEKLIETAIAAVGDPDHRAAAQHLLGRGQGRWRPLKHRGAEAAAVFHIGWDAYRRRHNDLGISALDETLGLVASAIIDSSGTVAADGTAVGGAPDRPVSTEGTERTVVVIGDSPVESAVGATPELRPRSTPRRSRQLVAGVAVLVGAIVVVVVIGMVTTASPDRSGVDCGDRTNRIGDVRPESDPILKSWSEPFRAFGAKLDPALVRCAGFIEAGRGDVVQRVAATGDAQEGAIIVPADAPPDAALYLSPPELSTFMTRNEETAEPEDRLGSVIERADWPDGTRVVSFESGVIISESDRAPAFAVTKRFWETWTRLGGLNGEPGRPIGVASTDTGEARRQDFEGGYLAASFTDGELVWNPVTSSPPSLPDDHLGRIATVTDGQTSWFIDSEGVRHWLPTAETMTCVARSQVEDGLRGVDIRVIAALPLGTVAHCH